MMYRHLRDTLRQFGDAIELSGEAAPVEQQLLERFVRWRDEHAFTALVRRHGPMVLGVCRRLLRREQDVEDVFQATFLVLARRAASIRKAASLGSWLHGVALRTAHKLRRDTRQFAPLPREIGGPDSTAEVVWREVGHVLDQELGRLPEKYRAPLILCGLQGLSQEEAARQLELQPGVLRGRLDRGRDRLRQRLTQRGLAVPATLFVSTLAESALVPAALTAATLPLAGGHSAASISPRVVSLAEGVLRAMTNLTRIKILAAALAVLIMLGSGAGLAVYQVWGAQGDTPGAAFVATTTNEQPPVVPAGQTDAKDIQGLWRLVRGEFEGKDTTEAQVEARTRWTISADTITIFHKGNKGGSWKYKLDPKAQPPAIDLTASGPQGDTVMPCIYQLEGDRLTVCIQNFPAKGRPKDFITTPNSGIGKYVYARMKPEEVKLFDHPPPPPDKPDIDIKENLQDRANLLWLLKLQGTKKEGELTKKLVQELAKLKVPTMKDAVAAAMKLRFDSGKGIDAQESSGVVALLRAGNLQVGGKAEYIWVIRSWRPFAPGGPFGPTLIEEVWVNANTGEARVVFPFAAKPK